MNILRLLAASIVIAFGPPGSAAGLSDGDFIRAVPSCGPCRIRARVAIFLPTTGVTFEKAKVWNALTRVTEVVALSTAGQLLDERAIRSAEDDATFKQIGAFTRETFDTLTRAASSAEFTLDLWGRAEQGYVDRASADIVEKLLQATLSEASARAAVADLQTAAGRLSGAASWVPDRAAPWLKVRASAGELLRLKGESSIALAALDPGPGKDTGTTYIYAVEANQTRGYGGLGTTTAIDEGCQPDSYSQLTVVYPGNVASTTGCTDWHMTWTAGIVANTVSGNQGIAPTTTVLIADWDKYAPANGDTEIEWAKSRGARQISFSHTFSNGSFGPISAHDMWFDWHSKTTPYPLFVSSAGNGGADPALFYVQNRHFNGLVVGGSDDRNTNSRADDLIYSASSWGNPAGLNGDRELPEVVAPGVNVTGAQYNGNGTSASAPIVAGIAALVEQRSGLIADYPEAKRAIIMATASQNVDGVFPLNLSDAVDDRDGVGEVDALRAITLADPANRVSQGAAARQLGYDFRSTSQCLHCCNAGFGFTNFCGPFNYQATAASRVRAIIAWDATATCTNSHSAFTCTADTLDVDFDLEADDFWGDPIAVSASFDNSYEIIDIPVVNGQVVHFWVSAPANNRTSTHAAIAFYQYSP